MITFEGFRKITFSTVLATHGWDLAYDLDGYMKTIDRPNVPRISPTIRLTKEGHPATTRHETTGRRIEKTLASIYFPEMKGAIKVIYDPNFEDVDYRYRVVRYAFDPDPHSHAGDMREVDCSTYGGLGAALSAFCNDWVDRDHLNCMDHYQTHLPGIVKAPIPNEYKARGYGLFG